MYYQFYTPKCEDPIHAGYIKPNLAGVLTGYDFQTLGKESWELYIRRHGGEENNKVKLGCMFEKDGIPQPPAAGISSKIYRIEKGDNLNPVGRAIVTLPEGTEPVTTQYDFEVIFNTTVNADNSEEIVLDSNLFDCSRDNKFDINGLLNYYDTKKLIMVGDNDFSCVNMDELEVDYVEADDETTGSGRRLAASEPKRFENKRFLSITIGKNKYKKQSLYIKSIISICYSM